MRILVVEDEQRLAAALKRGLEAEGFTVDVAFDGEDGLWRATQNVYDVVLLDIMLPGLNGYQICRVPVPTSGDEISLLAQTMNDMLDRLETAAKRQSRFVADASHELRSPLTAMRATMEINLAHPYSADWQATTADLLVDQDRLERIVADLLSLAKSDAGVIPLLRTGFSGPIPQRSLSTAQ